MELQSFPSNISDTEQGSTSVNTDLQPLYKAVCGGDLDAVNKFLIDHPEAVRARITPNGYTALHLAVIFKHFHIIEKLLELMSPEDLEVTSLMGSTPLYYATPDTNNVKIAKCLVEKNEKLPTISDGIWIPVTLALDFGNIELARYLYTVTPVEVLLRDNGIHGAVLLRRCYHFKVFDVALDLLKHCPRLVVTKGFPSEANFLEALASAPLAILYESQLPCWQQRIYKWLHQEPTPSINEILDSILETNTKEDDNISTSPEPLLEAQGIGSNDVFCCCYYERERDVTCHGPVPLEDDLLTTLTLEPLGIGSGVAEDVLAPSESVPTVFRYVMQDVIVREVREYMSSPIFA